MLLYIIFLYCISVTRADIFNAFWIREAFIPITSRDPSKPEYSDDPSCDQMAQTDLTPFLVILLLKSSGRFVAMGSIIDKTTVLTGSAAVNPVTSTPYDVLVLAGRLGPWWGRGSQVKSVKEIHVHNEAQLALVQTKKPFRYNSNVAPIRLLVEDMKNFVPTFDKHYAIFGIPRSNFDIPGDHTPKSSIYIMKIETLLIEKKDLDPCKFHFLDSNYYEEKHICTFANGTFCWGCIGSPTVAMDKSGNLYQIAVVSRVPLHEKDLYHRHTKVGPFINWIKSQSFITYKND